MPDDLIERVRAVVARSKNVPLASVTIDSTFEELGMDSLDGVNLLFEVEEEFNISIPDEVSRSIRSVRDVVAGVEKLTTGQHADTSVPQGS